jgi:ribonuclease P protein component
LRILFQEKSSEPYTAQLAVSVPKRLFRRAVDRNLLKRRIREAYRLNKSVLQTLLQEKDRTIMLVIQYQHKEIEKYQVIEEALIKGLSKMAEILKQKH